MMGPCDDRFESRLAPSRGCGSLLERDWIHPALENVVVTPGFKTRRALSLRGGFTTAGRCIVCSLTFMRAGLWGRWCE